MAAPGANFAGKRVGSKGLKHYMYNITQSGMHGNGNKCFPKFTFERIQTSYGL